MCRVRFVSWVDELRCVRRTEVPQILKGKVRGQRQPHPPAPPSLLREEVWGLSGFEGGWWAQCAPVEDNVSSAEQRKTEREIKRWSYRNRSHGNNWQLITSEWLTAVFIRFIHGRPRSIPRPHPVLKWDNMGFFTSMKIGGILAFALGETLSRVDWRFRGGGRKMQRVLSWFTATRRFYQFAWRLSRLVSSLTVRASLDDRWSMLRASFCTFSLQKCNSIHALLTLI